jgi:hypothetical protein
MSKEHPASIFEFEKCRFMVQNAYIERKERGYLMHRRGEGFRILSRPVERLRRKMSVFRLTVFLLQEENGIVRKDGPYEGPCRRKMGSSKAAVFLQGLEERVHLNYIIFNSHRGGGVHTWSSRHVGHFWPIVPAPGDCENGEFG